MDLVLYMRDLDPQIIVENALQVRKRLGWYWQIATHRFLVAWNVIEMRCSNADFYAHLRILSRNWESFLKVFFVKYCTVLTPLLNLPLFWDNFIGADKNYYPSEYLMQAVNIINIFDCKEAVTSLMNNLRFSKGNSEHLKQAVKLSILLIYLISGSCHFSTG